ncbi:MAG TPA: bifunctional DNA primase/polymerase [Scandinavium sp.]|uniref:bifunctional DNA primase/polymerase n=1 Tax=Scandinavium sp. TaxID=2830653 RepID=UPI002E3660A3|nr:bifunctional DNA primase/polymerase [Scandinavium sp.]HEX4501903.1 bifunctional DNA primase/polymerase [Scandinavium sp.]
MIEEKTALLSFLEPGTNLRDAALAYAANRMFVVCLREGEKKPVFKNWQRRATTKADEIRDQWGGKDYNIGIALQLSGLAVMDIDPRNGGDKTLQELQEEHGDLPSTYTVRSGGGGSHFYYRVPADLDRSMLPQKIGPGLELKKSGQVVVPPSITDSTYKVVQGSPLELAPLPYKWIFSVLGDRIHSDEGIQFADTIMLGERNDKCTQLAGLFRRHGATEQHIHAIIDGLGEHGLIEGYHDIDNKTGKTFAEYDVPLIAQSVAKYPQEAMHFLDMKLRINSGKRAIEPKAKDAPYGILGEFIKLTNKYSEAHHMAILATSLTMIGNMMSPYLGFSVGKTWHPPLLYTLVVGPTSEGAKGQSESRCEELMELVDEGWVDKITSGLASGEGLIEAIADATMTGETSTIQGKKVAHTYNAGHADKRLMIFEPELGRLIKVLQRQGNTTMETLIDLWDRGFASKLTIQSRHVKDARISVVMHAPMVVVQEQMSYDWLMNGFGNRFIWVWAKRTHLEPIGHKIPEEALDPIATDIIDAVTVLADRFDTRKKPLEVGFTRDGAEYWEELYEELSKDKYSGHLETAMGRRRSYARRIAMIFAALDFKKRIDVHHLDAAMSLIDYNEETLVHLFGQSTGDKVADRIYLALVEHASGLTRTEIVRDILQSNYTKAQIDVATKKLLERGLINETSSRLPGKRKRETVYVAIQKQ